MTRAAVAVLLAWATAVGAGCDLYVDAGDSTPGDSSVPTTCEAPSTADTTSVCGFLDEVGGCDGCDVALSIHDLVDFFAAPAEAPTLAARLGTVGDHFFFVDVPAATVSSYVIVAEPSGGAPSATVVFAPPGARVTGAELPIAGDALLDAWRAAGVADLDTRGAVLARYRARGDPAAEVTAIAYDTPLAWHYLGDDLATLAPGGTATGASGAALAVGAPLHSVTGDGGVPADCWWPDRFAGAVPGMLVTVTLDARCP